MICERVLEREGEGHGERVGDGTIDCVFVNCVSKKCLNVKHKSAQYIIFSLFNIMPKQFLYFMSLIDYNFFDVSKIFMST